MKKRWPILLLSMIMLFSLTMPAFAAQTDVPTIGTGTETQEATAFITKNLVIAEGVSIPLATFRFVVTPKTEKAPAAHIADIMYPNLRDQVIREIKKDDGSTLYEHKLTSPIVFEKFPHAGVYEYTVEEKANTYTGEGTMTYSCDVYTLRVYVANKADGTVFIQTITAEKEGVKQPEIAFTNTYSRNTSLVIKKQTTGNLADKDKEFDFTIRFTSAGTSGETSFIGSLNTVPLTCPIGQDVSFRLHDGQTLVFNQLPAGTRYIVTEKGAADGYTPQVHVIENGVKLPNKPGEDGKDLTSVALGACSSLAGETKNEVIFINTFKDVPITGVILHNLPFILLIGATVLALATLTVCKRKNTSKHS